MLHLSSLRLSSLSLARILELLSRARWRMNSSPRLQLMIVSSFSCAPPRVLANMASPWLASLPKEQSVRVSLWRGFDFEHESAMATQLLMLRESLVKTRSSMGERGTTAQRAMTWLSSMLRLDIVQLFAPMLTVGIIGESAGSSVNATRPCTLTA